MDALKSWKTTVAGVACLAAVGAFATGHITLPQMMETLGVLMGGGFIASQDAGKK